MTVALDPPLGSDLVPEHRQVLQAIYDSWNVDVRWPRSQWIDKVLDRNNGPDLFKILPSIPERYILYNRYSPTDSELKLTLAGIASCAHSAGDVHLFMRTLRWCADRERTFRPRDPTKEEELRLTSQDAENDWTRSGADVSPLILRKAFALADAEHIHHGCGQSSEDPTDWNLAITRSIRPYRDTTSFEEYLATKEALRRDLMQQPPIIYTHPGMARKRVSPITTASTIDGLEIPTAVGGSTVEQHDDDDDDHHQQRHTVTPMQANQPGSTSPPANSGAASGMTKQEITRLVNRYIGVSGGYLGDFSYRTHADFYPEYCNLDITPGDYAGTTRERFITILLSQAPHDQAKIVRGVIERFPVGQGPPTRTAAYRDELRALAQRLETGQHVTGTTPTVTSDTVRRTIADVERLLPTSGPVSAVDRIHTALHGHLIWICDDSGISHPADTSLTAAFKLVRSNHPKFAGTIAQSKEIDRMVQACATIVDAMNPIRNQASVAHPNPALLGDAEARLVIDIGRSLLNYLDAKLKS